MGAPLLTPVEVEQPVATPVKTDEPDHDRMTHVVLPAKAVTEAYITGAAVTALCGKTWVPTRPPEKFPGCPTCFEILNELRARQGKPPITPP